MNTRTNITLSSILALIVMFGMTLQQTYATASLLTSEEEAFATAVNTGAYAYDITDTLATEMGTVDMPLGEAWRPAGSDAEHEVADYLVEEMGRIGLQNIAKEGFPVHAYTFRGASVSIASGTDMLATGFGGVVGTPEGGITAPLVYVGLGGKADYEGKDVTGKIVLVDVNVEEMNWLHIPHYEAEIHGAAGLIVHWVGLQPMADSIATFDSMSRQTIPAVGVSEANFELLKTVATNGGSATMTSDVEINTSGTSYNVMGYIPGTEQPEKLIVVGAHYDKWWYGASDDSGGIGQMLGIAKAMIDSGYQPTNTIVFLATGAEEFGWTDTNFDWAIGSYAHMQLHPDWAGRTLAYFMLDNGAGITGSTAISADGSPEMYSFRQSVIPVLDSYFSSTAPWSAYYTKSSASYALPTTWGDEFSFGAAGVPTMSIITEGELTLDDFYHTQFDDMNSISAEALGMATIANGITAIRLDRSEILPFNMETWGESIDNSLKRAVLRNENIDVKPINTAIRDFRKTSRQVWKKIQENGNPTNAETVNALLLETEKKIASELLTIGGYDLTSFPHEHYQNDAPALRKASNALANGNVQKTLKNLQNINGMYEGVNISRPVYKEMIINRHNPSRTDLFWATGRLATFSDLYDEYFSIQANGATEENKQALETKHANASQLLQNAIDKEVVTLNQATTLLESIENTLP